MTEKGEKCGVCGNTFIKKVLGRRFFCATRTNAIGGGGVQEQDKFIQRTVKASVIAVGSHI